MTPADFRQHRDRLGLTQAALGALLYKTASHIARVEQGNTRPSETLCELLRMKVAEKERLPGKRGRQECG